MMNHLPTIPPLTDNDEANKRNLKLLNVEWEKKKRSNEVMKILMTHTYPFKRSNSEDICAEVILFAWV